MPFIVAVKALILLYNYYFKLVFFIKKRIYSVTTLKGTFDINLYIKLNENVGTSSGKRELINIILIGYMRGAKQSAIKL